MAYVVYSMGGSQYNEMMEMAHDIKKIACKMAKCLKEAEEREDDEDYYEEEDYYEDDMNYRGPQYREPGEEGLMPHETVPHTKMRRSRGANGRYTRMRRPPMRSRYDIRTY